MYFNIKKRFMFEHRLYTSLAVLWALREGKQLLTLIDYESCTALQGHRSAIWIRSILSIHNQ